MKRKNDMKKAKAKKVEAPVATGNTVQAAANKNKQST